MKPYLFLTHFFFSYFFSYFFSFSFIFQFVIKPDSSGGYVGCFRDKYASGNMLNADMWFVNNFGSHSITPATCAWMCREKGFTLSSNDWYSHHCRCGDKYGSHTCDTWGHCGLPQLEDSLCHFSCDNSDRLQKCGGHYYSPRSIAIYKTTGESYVLPTDLANTICSAADTSTPCSRVYDGRNDQAWKSTTGSYDAGTKLVQHRNFFFVCHVVFFLI